MNLRSKKFPRGWGRVHDPPTPTRSPYTCLCIFAHKSYYLQEFGFVMYIIEERGWQVIVYYLHSSYKLRKHIVQRCVVIIYDFNIRVLLCNIFIIKWYKRTGDIIFGHFSFKEMFLLMETKFWTTRSLEDSGVPSNWTIINTAVSSSS